MSRVLTGIQPSGELHLGNYFGAVRPCLQHQENSETDLFLFVADYHALTTVHDNYELLNNIYQLVPDLLALGIDPHKSTLFQQSHIPETAELTLLLTMVTGMGLLQRGHSYKDKVSKGITPTVGLFIYPVLMAADILLYRSEIVPVGKDQIQHVQMARDMAIRFNEEFGHTFDLPKEVVSEVPKVPGIDGQKMSKSYGNTISPFDEGDELRAKLAKIPTDSTPYGDPLPTEGPLFELLKLMCNDSEELEEVRGFFRTGRRGSQKFGYGLAKQLLAEKIENQFAEARERRHHITDKDLHEALNIGATRAQRIANETIETCRGRCGVG